MSFFVENKVHGFFSGSLLLLIVFWVFFSGDASVFGIKIFYFIFFIFFIILDDKYIKEINFRSISLVFLFIFYLLFHLAIYKLEYFDYSYFLWPTQILLSTVILIYVVEVMKSEHGYSFYSGIYYLALFVMFFLSVGSFFFSDGARSNFIFGPNIHYRIYAVLTIFMLYSLVKQNCENKFIYIFVFIVFISSNFLTGSRAALINIPLILIAFIHAYTKISALRGVAFMMIGVFIFIFLSPYFDINFDSRLINFDYENNNSLALRLRPWVDFVDSPLDYMFSFGMSYDLFMEKFGDEQFPYPHNIFLELIMFFGFLGLLVALFILCELVRSLRRMFFLRFNNLETIFIYCFLIFFVGASFSGSLMDNCSLISILLVCIYIRKSDEIR